MDLLRRFLFLYEVLVCGDVLTKGKEKNGEAMVALMCDWYAVGMLDE